MRELTLGELSLVSGGTGTCSAEDSGNSYGGVSDVQSIGQDIIDAYEGLVEATSHIIERVANALQ